MIKILLVDDDRELTTELAEMIRTEGFLVDTASSGPEGEERVLAGDYSAAIIDFKMPGFDGIELLKKIHDQRPNVKVIIMSGSLDIQKKIDEKELRPIVGQAMQKPFDPAVLIGNIKRLTE